jgi:hypothetical protein
MNVKQRQSNKYISILSYPIRKLRQVQSRKRFNIFWNKLTKKDQERVILILGANNNQGVPSLSHLKCILFLVKNCYDNEKWTYGGIE